MAIIIVIIIIVQVVTIIPCPAAAVCARIISCSEDPLLSNTHYNTRSVNMLSPPFVLFEFFTGPGKSEVLKAYTCKP